MAKKETEEKAIKEKPCTVIDCKRIGNHWFKNIHKAKYFYCEKHADWAWSTNIFSSAPHRADGKPIVEGKKMAERRMFCSNCNIVTFHKRKWGSSWWECAICKEERKIRDELDNYRKLRKKGWGTYAYETDKQTKKD